MSSSAAQAARIRATSLYRSILRAHQRHLPNEMRSIGDAYVKSEFKLHKKASKPEQIEQFFEEWKKYLDQILMTARAKESASVGSIGGNGGGGAQKGQQQQSSSVFAFGSDLPPDVELSDEQRAQLEKLKEEAGKVRR